MLMHVNDHHQKKINLLFDHFIVYKNFHITFLILT